MEWTRGPTVGRGSTATVSIATTASGQILAVKSSESSFLLRREEHFLSQFNSPYVVDYLGFDVTCENTKPTYNLFLEYLPGGTLSDSIKESGGSLDEAAIRIYTNQILNGLTYLHMNGVVHCDLKPQNVLIGKDGAKIADLGCAKMAGDEFKFSGTPIFMAPEVARGEEQSFPADIWSLGCIIIEMFTGSNPWPEIEDPVSALYKIGHSCEIPEIPNYLSREAKDFVGKCLRRDSKDRWTAEQLLDHTFLQNSDSVFLNFLKTEECTRKSPTCVLDLGFWDSLEPCRDSITGSSSFNSPAERLGGLIGGCLSNWGAEEDWVTVRLNHIEENNDLISEDESEISHLESSTNSSEIVEEEEWLIDDWSIDETRVSGDDYTRIDPLFYHLFKDFCVSIVLNFEKELNEIILVFQCGIVQDLSLKSENSILEHAAFCTKHLDTRRHLSCMYNILSLHFKCFGDPTHLDLFYQGSIQTHR